MGGFYFGCAMLAVAAAIVVGLTVLALGLWMTLAVFAFTALLLGLLYGGLELTRI